MITNSVNIFKN